MTNEERKWGEDFLVEFPEPDIMAYCGIDAHSHWLSMEKAYLAARKKAQYENDKTFAVNFEYAKMIQELQTQLKDIKFQDLDAVTKRQGEINRNLANHNADLITELKRERLAHDLIAAQCISQEELEEKGSDTDYEDEADFQTGYEWAVETSRNMQKQRRIEL